MPGTVTFGDMLVSMSATPTLNIMQYLLQLHCDSSVLCERHLTTLSQPARLIGGVFIAFYLAA
jgi:hypothetical protein